MTEQDQRAGADASSAEHSVVRAPVLSVREPHFGFAQGVLWVHGLYAVNELREQNR